MCVCMRACVCRCGVVNGEKLEGNKTDNLKC